MADTIDLTFLGKQIDKLLTRVKNAETLAMQNLEMSRRLERHLDLHSRQIEHVGLRVGEAKDDIELMLKAELMGRLTHFETRIEQTIDEKLDAFRTELLAEIRQVLAERK